MTLVTLPSNAPPLNALSSLASVISAAGGLRAGGVEAALARFYADLDVFEQELRMLSASCFDAMLTLSRETPTHYKWHLFANDDTHVHVWLHEYKPTSVRSQGYTQTVHNHRYPMTALLLAGGYCCTKYAVTPDSDNLHADVRVLDAQRLFGGNVYSMGPNEFHSLSEIQNGTVSLMVQGKAVRSYSTSVDAVSRLIATHTPIEYRLNNLRSVLGAMNQRS